METEKKTIQFLIDSLRAMEEKINCLNRELMHVRAEVRYRFGDSTPETAKGQQVDIECPHGPKGVYQVGVAFFRLPEEQVNERDKTGIYGAHDGRNMASVGPYYFKAGTDQDKADYCRTELDLMKSTAKADRKQMFTPARDEITDERKRLIEAECELKILGFDAVLSENEPLIILHFPTAATGCRLESLETLIEYCEQHKVSAADLDVREVGRILNLR